MIDLSPCDSAPGNMPLWQEPRRDERVLHIHLGAPGEPQTSLCDELFQLTGGGDPGYITHERVNWYAQERNALPEIILRAAARVQPTLIWMQLQGKVLEPSFLRILKKRHPNALIVSWCGDVGRDPAWSHELAPVLDALLFSSMTQVEEHRAAGFPNAAYLQIGYDTDVHHLPEREAFFDRKHRLVFLGQNYDDKAWTHLPGHEAQLRRDAVRAMRDMEDVDFVLYGQNWDGHWGGEGVLNREGSAECYRNSTCALSISLTSKLKRYSSDRLLRALACGPAVFVKRFAEMSSWGLQHRVNCLVWSTIAELRDLARWAFYPYSAFAPYSIEVGDEVRAELREIGFAGALLAREFHTWERRMGEQAVYLEYLRSKRGT